MKYDFKTTRRSPLEIEDSTIPKKTILKRVIGARGVLLDLGYTRYELRGTILKPQGVPLFRGERGVLFN
jgi:hypothetical protein